VTPVTSRPTHPQYDAMTVEQMNTLQEANMAKAAKKTGTRVARWFGALLERKYYDTFE
jgi:hypothetical protein